jgi:hypothetical protein
MTLENDDDVIMTILDDESSASADSPSIFSLSCDTLLLPLTASIANKWQNAY